MKLARLRMFSRRTPAKVGSKIKSKFAWSQVLIGLKSKILNVLFLRQITEAFMSFLEVVAFEYLVRDFELFKSTWLFCILEDSKAHKTTHAVIFPH